MSLDCCFVEEVFRPLDCSLWAGRADRSPTNILRIRDLFKFDAMRRSIGSNCHESSEDALSICNSDVKNV